MEHQVFSMGLALVLATTLRADTADQSDCTSVLLSMSPCFDYISGNSSDASSACCTQLGSAVQSQLQCLCRALNGGAIFGLSINRTQALALPNACNVQTPPTNRCNNATSPSQNSPNSDSGDDGSSDANSNRMTYFSLLFFLIFTASYISTFDSYFLPRTILC